jgi:hypothetical protein
VIRTFDQISLKISDCDTDSAAHRSAGTSDSNTLWDSQYKSNQHQMNNNYSHQLSCLDMTCGKENKKKVVMKRQNDAATVCADVATVGPGCFPTVCADAATVGPGVSLRYVPVRLR